MSIIAFILLDHLSRLALPRALFFAPLFGQVQAQFQTQCAQVVTSATTSSARMPQPAIAGTRSVSLSSSKAPSRSQVARATHQIQGHPRPTCS